MLFSIIKLRYIRITNVYTERLRLQRYTFTYICIVTIVSLQSVYVITVVYTKRFDCAIHFGIYTQCMYDVHTFTQYSCSVRATNESHTLLDSTLMKTKSNKKKTRLSGMDKKVSEWSGAQNICWGCRWPMTYTTCTHSIGWYVRVLRITNINITHAQ